MRLRIDGSFMGMGVGRVVLLLGLVWAGFAQAAGPIEVPPQDYTANQYIDSAGCVYRRQGPVWAPRLDGDGAVICGYPPSLPGYVGPAVNDTEDLALRLAVTLADGLQDADMLADPPDTLKREEVATPKPTSGPLSELDKAATAMPALREASAGFGGSDSRLCDLLGYGAGAGNPNGGAGGGTLGYCDGPSTSLQPKIVSGETTQQMADKGAGTKVADGAQASAGSAGDKPTGAASAVQAPVKHAATAKTASPAADGGGKAAAASGAAVAHRGGVDPALVPANARFVQIGRFAEADQAEAMIRRLASLGYPVVRGVKADEAAGGRVVMAGPFGDRRSVIAALSHLREAGFSKAFAR